MLKIDLQLDVATFDRDVDAAIRGDVMPKVADFVNEVAEAARLAVQEAMRSGLDRPTPFTIQGVKVFAARATGVGSVDAVVFIADLQAGYLDLQVTPGTRRAGDPGTTRLGPLVPGPAAPRDRFGNLPRGYIAEVVKRPDVAWVHLRPNAPPVLIRRLPGDRIEVLAVIATETHYDTVRLPFFDIVRDAVEKASRAIT